MRAFKVHFNVLLPTKVVPKGKMRDWKKMNLASREKFAAHCESSYYTSAFFGTISKRMCDI